MLDYIVLILSVFLNSGSITLNKAYQIKTGTSLKFGIIYNIINGIVSAMASVVTMWICGYSFQFSWYSAFIALIVVISSGAQFAVSFKVFETCGIASYNMFMMLGGAFIPSLCSFAFLGEFISALKWTGLFTLSLAVVLVGTEQGKEGKSRNGKLGGGLFYCVLGFLFSGALGWFTKLHQVDIGMSSVPPESFLMLISLGRVLLFSSLLKVSTFKKIQNNPVAPLPVSSISIATASAFAWCLAYLFTLYNATVLPAAVMFPISTGGGLILGALAGKLFFRERLSPVSITGLSLAIASTFMFFA